MTFPAWLAELLPADTAATWELIAPVVPEASYLAGGTAVAVHMQHRMSRDLDIFLEEPIDLENLVEELEALGPLHVSRFEPTPGEQTLEATFSATKLQFLEASRLKMCEHPSRVAGLRVAGLRDLLAMKLKVITDRGELRDYFDLLVIDRESPYRAEAGLQYLQDKYPLHAPDDAVRKVLLALSYLEDVEPDPLVPLARAEIANYWAQRLPEITAHLARQE